MQPFKKLYVAFLWILLVAIVLPSACKEKPPPRSIEPSFYYWKSSFKLDKPLPGLIDKLHIKRLYIKFFDVSWNGQTEQPMPMAIVKLQQPAEGFSDLAIIPTVFITNECMERMDSLQVFATAEKIYTLIMKICVSNSLQVVPEIQVDCDWNATTKNKYFALLGSIRHFAAASHMQLSATIRLHQCKYLKQAGIPPVDRGLLMCYNMGNLKDPSTSNSILEVKELEKYLSGLWGYPLPLDLALPLFGWKVLFRNNMYSGLISELPTRSLVQNPAIKQSGNRYTVLYDTSMNGYDLKAGDLLRDEQVTFKEIIKAAEMLAPKLKTKRLAVSLYHLDSLTLSKYSLHELETIFDRFR